MVSCLSRYALWAVLRRCPLPPASGKPQHSARVARSCATAGGTLCPRKVSKPFVGSSLRQLRRKRRIAADMRNSRLLLVRNIINRKFWGIVKPLNTRLYRGVFGGDESKSWGRLDPGTRDMAPAVGARRHQLHGQFDLRDLRSDRLVD